MTNKQAAVVIVLGVVGLYCFYLLTMSRGMGS